MTFGHAITTCMRKYFTFSGRASRSEFWWFVVFGWIVWSPVWIFDIPVEEPLLYLAGETKRELEFHPVFSFALFNTVIYGIPSLAVGSRRLHDVGKSGWWQLLEVTIIGYIPLLIWWLKKPNNDEETAQNEQVPSSKERGTMSKALTVFVIIAVVFFGYPLFNEDASSECSAFEKRALLLVKNKSAKDNPFASLLIDLAGNLSDGYVAKTALKEKYPNLPPALGCTLNYWRFITDPKEIESELRAIIK